MVLELIICATVLVSLISLLGIVFFFFDKKKVGAWMMLLVGFSTGAILGAAFFDLLPESVGSLGASVALAAAFAGVICAFAMERVVHLHHHHHVDHKGEHKHPLGMLTMAGDTVHNFFDGVAISAGFIAGMPLGIATTIAVIFHEIPHEIGNFSLLIYSGYERKTALKMNFLTALSAIAGGVLFYFFAGQVKGLEGWALAFTGGMFIYIACADIMPEIHKETDTRRSILQLLLIILGAAMIAGVAFALG